jgi:hypothetical protein
VLLHSASQAPEAASATRGGVLGGGRAEGRPGQRASSGGNTGEKGVGGVGRRQNSGSGLGFVNRTDEPGRGEMHEDRRIDYGQGQFCLST